MSKTAIGLVEYAKAQLGRPYWYGSFGQAGSKEFYEQKKNQYPNQYTWDYDGTTEKVHDCVGLIKGYLWCDGPEDTTPVYNAAQDKSANGMYTACKTKGEMATMPDVPGVLVFMNNHVGVYIGNGEVIEARSRRYGVYKTKLAERSWKNWGYCPYITYETPKTEETKSAGTITVNLPVLKRGAKGETVRAMQHLLMGNGHDMEGYGADASFGGATERALKAYQGANGLEADGSCGPKTWAKLLGLN